MSSSSLARFFALVLAGLLIFLVYLYLTVGIHEIVSVFKSVNLYSYLLYYITALSAVFLSTLFYSMSWNEIMRSIGIKVGWGKAYLYCWLGIFIDLIVPFETISGELTRLYVVQRDTNEQPGKIVASLVAHRIISTSIALGSLIVSSAFLMRIYSVNQSIFYAILALTLSSAVLVMLLLLVSLKRGIAEKIINPVLNFAASISRGRISLPETKNIVYMNLQYFYNDFRIIGNKRWALLRAVLYGLLAWFLHLSVFFLTFYAINFPEVASRIYETIIVYSISTALQSSPVSLAPGLTEIVMMNLYALLGFNVAVSGAATLLIRVATFWVPVAFGGIVAQWIGVKNLLAQMGKNTSTC